MTRWLCILCTVFSVTGCSSETIKIENDAINKKTIVKMRMTHHSVRNEESNTAEARYVRSFNDEGILQPTIVHVEITTPIDAAKLSKNAYMKMGIIKKKVVLQDIQSETVKVEGSSSGTGDNKDTGKKYTVYRAKMPFTIPIERHIRNADEVLYRFYFGSRGINYSVEGKQLEKLKEFMRAGLKEVDPSS